MSKKNIKIINVIHEIVVLLSNNNEQYWAEIFSSFEKNFQLNPEMTSEKILSVYGGMGSFNDLVLCNNMVPLGKENDTLENLKEELYIKVKYYK